MKEIFAILGRRFGVFVMICAVVTASSASPQEGATKVLPIVVDIAPVEMLVARLVQGTPARIVTLVAPGADPHDYAFKPSDISALNKAALQIVVGPDLTPWLTPHLGRASGAVAAPLVLMETVAEFVLPIRHGAALDQIDDHSDPHAWLDPAVARAWSTAIAVELARVDPAHAALYAENAAAAAREIDDASAMALDLLAGARTAFVVEHDAFQYFERFAGIGSLGAVRDAEGAAPGPRRLGRIRSVARQADCLIGVPGTDPALARAIGIDRLVEIDPLGAVPDATTYPDLLINIARGYLDCGADQSN